MLSSVHHPSIIRAEDFFVDKFQNKSYLIVEYIDMKSLANILMENKKIPENKIKPIVIKILRGVNALHRAGICHRDI